MFVSFLRALLLFPAPPTYLARALKPDCCWNRPDSDHSVSNLGQNNVIIRHIWRMPLNSATYLYFPLQLTMK